MEALGPRLVRMFPGSRYVAHRGQGVPAYLSAGWLRTAVQQHRPDIVVIELGGNDGRTDHFTYQQQAHRLAAEAGNARVIWVGPAFATVPDVQERHLQAHESLRTMGLPYIDSMSITSSGHRGDGVHFAPGGYDRWANYIATTLRAEPTTSRWLYLGTGAALTLLAYALLGRQKTAPTAAPTGGY